MDGEAFPGTDSRGSDDKEVELLVIGREARVYLTDTFSSLNLQELKDKLQRHLADEAIDSVVIYCGNLSPSPELYGVLLSIYRQNRAYDKELILSGINQQDSGEPFQGFGWEIEESS